MAFNDLLEEDFGRDRRGMLEHLPYGLVILGIPCPPSVCLHSKIPILSLGNVFTKIYKQYSTTLRHYLAFTINNTIQIIEIKNNLSDIDKVLIKKIKKTNKIYLLSDKRAFLLQQEPFVSSFCLRNVFRSAKPWADSRCY